MKRTRLGLLAVVSLILSLTPLVNGQTGGSTVNVDAQSNWNSTPTGLVFQQVTGVPGSIKFPLSNVYPKKIVQSAEACKSSGNSRAAQNSMRLGCMMVESLATLHRACTEGTPNKASVEACKAVADDSAKSNDYVAAAIFYQAACDQGDKKSCSRAMDNKKKTGL